MSELPLPRVHELGVLDHILNLFESRIAVITINGQEYLSSGALLVEDGSVYLHFASMTRDSRTMATSIPRDSLNNALISGSRLFIRTPDSLRLDVQFHPEGYVNLDKLGSTDSQTDLGERQEHWNRTKEKLRQSAGRPVNLTELEVKALAHELQTERCINHIATLPARIRVDMGQIRQTVQILAEYNRTWEVNSDAAILHVHLIKPLFLTD